VNFDPVLAEVQDGADKEPELLFLEVALETDLDSLTVYMVHLPVHSLHPEGYRAGRLPG